MRAENPIPPTEEANPESADLDRRSPGEIALLMAQAERASVAAFERAAPAVGQVAAAAADALRRGGRIFFAGAGTSGRLGALEAAECPPTFGCDPSRVRAIVAGGAAALSAAVEGAEDRAEEAALALARERAGPRDFIVAIAASGRTPFARAALDYARAEGVRSAFITCDPAVAEECPPPADDVVVLLTGPEVVAGSTRLKAGSATKMVLNAVTTGAFTAIGAVYGNLMVDLRATNSKLAARARRIVAALTDAGDEEARAALSAAGGSVKLAVVMRRLGVGREEAKCALERAGGSLRSVIG